MVACNWQVCPSAAHPRHVATLFIVTQEKPTSQIPSTHGCPSTGRRSHRWFLQCRCRSQLYAFAESHGWPSAIRATHWPHWPKIIWRHDDGSTHSSSIQQDCPSTRVPAKAARQSSSSSGSTLQAALSTAVAQRSAASGSKFTRPALIAASILENRSFCARHSMQVSRV